jgi:glycine betaine catabolism B
VTLEIAPHIFASELLESREEGTKAKTLRLSVPGDFTFIPGMWLMTSLPSDPATWRAYSISTSPFQKGFVEITVGKAGDYSEKLCALAPGAELSLKGPYGKWLYRDDARSAVLISGGTGLTPFRSMARYVLDKKLPNKLTIVYSAKTPEEMIYRDDLAAFAKAGIAVHATVTRPAPGWSGPTGRVDAAALERLVEDFKGSWYYLCGPNAMVKELSDGLIARGVPAERVRRENWGDYKDL